MRWRFRRDDPAADPVASLPARPGESDEDDGAGRRLVSAGSARPAAERAGGATAEAAGEPALDGDATGRAASGGPAHLPDGDHAAEPAARPRRFGARHGPSRYRTAFFLLAIVSVVAVGGWLLYGSKFLAVRTVSVTGTSLVPKSEVLAVAGIPAGEPLIRLDTAAIASRVERIPQVQSVQVSRQWPDGVLIAVRERHPALAVPLVGGGFGLVDASGVVVRQVRDQPAGMPRFVPSGPLAGNAGVRAVASVLRQLPPGIARRVRSVTVPTLDAVTLHLSGHVTVDWGSTGQAAQKARVLAILMRTRASFYDVSAPDSAVTG